MDAYGCILIKLQLWAPTFEFHVILYTIKTYHASNFLFPIILGSQTVKIQQWARFSPGTLGPEKSLSLRKSGKKRRVLGFCFIIIIYYKSVYGVGGCALTHASINIWRSRDNFVKLVLFFYLYIGSMEQIQVARLLLHSL